MNTFAPSTWCSIMDEVPQALRTISKTCGVTKWKHYVAVYHYVEGYKLDGPHHPGVWLLGWFNTFGAFRQWVCDHFDLPMETATILYSTPTWQWTSATPMDKFTYPQIVKLVRNKRQATFIVTRQG